jgi:predicted dehydrogenase
VIAEVDDACLSWLCDTDTDRLARMARRYAGAQATTRAEDLFADPDLDAILIATPVFSHFSLAQQSLQAGKHTFVEKPLAGSSQEAELLLAQAEADGLVLMCGHTFLYSPPVRTVKQILERGELGDLQFISSSRVNLGLHQSDVSVLWDLAPHDFSILHHWLGELPVAVRASGRDIAIPGIHDVAFVTMRYGSGLLANLEMSWLAPSKLRRTVLVGSEKMLVYEDGAPEAIRIYDKGVVHDDPETFGEYQLSYRTGDVISPRIDSSEPLALEIGDFVRSVRSGGPPAGHGELCLDVVRLIEAAEESLTGDGAEICPTADSPVVV